MTKTKKPSPVFEVLFKGPGIYPEKIPLGKVTGALSAIKHLAAGELVGDEEDEDEVKDETDETVRLLDVVRGSAIFRFVGQSPATALERLREAGKILQNPDEVGQNDYVLRPIKDLSAIARSLGCAIVIKQPGSQNAVLATVDGNSYDRIAMSILITGDTRISGKVERVGGATEMRCGLRVSFQSRMLFCRVETEEVARKLGDLLYQRVIVWGTAQWLKNSMRVFSFMIKDVSQPKPGTITEALKAVWEAGLNDWEKVPDPDAYLQEIRGEG